MRLLIDERRDEAAGVVSLRLTRPDGRPLPESGPGAHVDLRLANGLVRQYSISSPATDRASWRLGILREPAGRGGSAYIHDTLRVGDLVEVSEPRNQFALEPAPRYVFLAGGIGITPILPMIARAEATGSEWTLLYGGRTRASMAFMDELAAYGDRVTIAPRDETGLLDLAGRLGTPVDGALVYACGPEPMLRAVESHTRDRWPAGALRLERFTPAEPGQRAADTGFEVECALSGLTLDIPPGRSILAVAGEAGIPVFSSCEQGTCGTCLTAIVRGRADHRDSLLSPAEREGQGCMLICVSRAEAGCPRLVLEL